MLAYFDCYSGVAGDMVLGAMLDAGLPFSHLKRELAKLHLKGYRLTKKIERRGVVGGVNLQVISLPFVRGGLGWGRYTDIRRFISTSRLNKNTRNIALAIFETLARAEAHIHRTSIDHVHFHEVGAIDSIVDIVGAAIGFDYFKFDEIYSSPLPVLYSGTLEHWNIGTLRLPLDFARGRSGQALKRFIKCAHGNLPLPAPATLEILKGVPLTQSPVMAEIVTPTGVAILKTVVKEFGACPLSSVKKIGYGLGDNNYKEVPNALRLMIGEPEKLIVIETNIDDMNPQIYNYVIERLLSAGALDASVIPVFMKKRRPGALLQVLCAEGKRRALTEIILKETTTFGVRFYPVEREILEREIKTVQTKYGPIRMKLGFLNGKRIKLMPEYEDCAKLAKKHKIPLKDVQKISLQ